MTTISEAQSQLDDGREWASHFLAYAYATSFLFGSVLVLNTLGLSYFLLYPRKISITLIGAQVDLLVWVASVLSISVLTIWLSKSQQGRAVPIMTGLLGACLGILLLTIPQDLIEYRIVAYILFAHTTVQFALQARQRVNAGARSGRRFLGRTLIYTLTYLLIIEISSAAYYATRSFSSTTTIGLPDAKIETQFAYVTYPLIPWLYAAFLFSWIWVPVLLLLIARSSRFRAVFSKETDQTRGLFTELPSTGLKSKLSDPRLLLALAVAVFIGYYPYFQSPPWLVGTDAYWRYYNPLMTMNGNGVIGGFVQALSERHPVALMIFYAAQLGFHTTAFEVLRYTPVFLIAMLGFSLWWFLARRKSVAFGLVIFLLSVLSIATTVGFYSSILANWMVLVGWVAFFAYASHRADERFRFLDFIILLIISTLTLLLHPWTWGVFAATVVLAATLALARERRRALRSGGILLSVILVDAILAVLSVAFLVNSQGWRIEDAVGLYTFVLRKPWTILFFWNALTRLTEIWSSFFGPLYLGFSILGVICLGTANLSAWRRRFIWAWICVSALGSLLVAPVGFDPSRPTQTESQLWRLLFLTPFQLTAPIGIAWLTQLPDRLRSNSADVMKSNLLSRFRGLSFAGLSISGLVFSLVPGWARLLLVVIPLLTAILLRRVGRLERAFLVDLILALFLLVAFNSVARSLSLLLIDPHNYRP